MSSHTLETYVEIAGSEVEAVVDFEYEPAIKGYIPRGEAFALEPDEPARVHVERIDVLDMTLRSGKLFDLIAKSVEDECFAEVSERAW